MSKLFNNTSGFTNNPWLNQDNSYMKKMRRRGGGGVDPSWKEAAEKLQSAFEKRGQALENVIADRDLVVAQRDAWLSVLRGMLEAGEITITKEEMNRRKDIELKKLLKATDGVSGTDQR